MHIVVNLGADISDNQNGHDTLERKSKGGIKEVRRVCRDAQDEDKTSTIRQTMLIEGERSSTLARMQSMMAAKENDQHNEGSDNDIPEDSPTPPAPPDKPAYTSGEHSGSSL